MRLYDKVIRICGTTDFMKGLNYQANKVKLTKIEDEDNFREAYFSVTSERINFDYHVYLLLNKETEELHDYKCTCPQYEKMDTCKHIAACILKYENALFNDEETDPLEYQLNLGSQILDKFYEPKKSTIKKKLNLEIELEPTDSYYYDNYIKVKYKIGLDRLYTLNNKYHNFMYAYSQKRSYKLSTKLTYDPHEHYFDKIDKEILDYNVHIFQRGYYECVIRKNDLDSFMDLLKDKDFTLNHNKYIGYIKENPFNINLTKENNNYTLTIDNLKDYEQLLEGAPYFYDNKKIYKVDDNIYKLYRLLVDNDLDSFMFSKKDLGKFTGGLLSLLKENIHLDENITEITIPTAPKAKLYFDFYYSAIECQIKLTYGNKELDYFSKDPGVPRDTEYESNILQRLSDFGFTVNQTHITLEDIDEIGEFLEKGIYEISEEYEVFTSKKIKDTNIVKQTQNSVTFSIGKDNILSYNFNLDGIEQTELTDILSSLKAKKHYHRLKNGSIIDLNADKNLQNLGELTDELDLTKKEITEGLGTIPKYRALYLDSLKNSYHSLISTNDNFDNLIKQFKTYKDKDIQLDKKELKVLRDYQVTGVKWLYNVYKSGFGGILADEMGLGKSIQLIYLTKLIIKENPKAKILIVTPTSLVYNWQKEFDKFGSELKYKVFAENKTQRLNELDNIDNTNIMITSYGLIRNDLEKYEQMSFELIAIDEAQNIKNPNTGIAKAVKSLNAKVKFALTGTPIENSLLELWSIFDFIMPGYLANRDKFQTLYNVKELDKENSNLNRLNTQIKYFILRRKKKDVVKDLPDKLENNIYIDLGKTQKKVYMAEVQKTKEELDELIKLEGWTKARFKILQLLTKLRQICIDPSIIFDNYKGESAKIEELLKIVEETKANGHKMLIFTTYKKALDLIIPKLNNIGISSYYIDGSVSSKKRMELVEKFNHDDTDVFIITLKAGGTGLNLTSATVVIHLDLWWNPQTENQATDRAHRIGQKNTVEVIRLITKGTIEERILELQNKKRKLAELLIDNENSNENNFSKLTEDDIKMLLSMDNE